MATTDGITWRFAAACGLLGRYAAMAAAAPTPASVQPGTVAQEGRASNAQQLTIFFGGMVVVIDGCTPEKAAELIRLAAAAARQGVPRPAPALVNTPVARKESLRRFLSKRKERAPATAPVLVSVPDSETVPYAPNKDKKPEPAAKKGKLGVSREEAATWLALGSLGGMHARS